MNISRTIRHGFAPLAAGLAILLLASAPAWAHCDRMDGPVVLEAKEALEQGEVTPVLKWVPADDEQEVREAFEQTLTVRQQGPEARDLADRYFFETLVRLHRASEGVAYTGIKPAGGEIHPAIAQADAALEEGSVDELAERIGNAVETNIREKFAQTTEAQADKDESVEAGRQFVFEYVQYVHYVKGIHEALHAEPHGHQPEDVHEELTEGEGEPTHEP